MPDRWTRRAPITGIIAVGFFILAFILGGETPSFDAGTREILDYYGDQTKQVIVSISVLYGSVFLVFFAATLRSTLRRAENLSLLVLIGGALLASGWTIFAGLSFTLADLASSDHLARIDPGTLQALNSLNSDFFFPVVLGVSIWLFSVALAILRTGDLPRWLGWAAVAIAIVSVTPAGFFSIPLLGLWILAASVILLRRGESDAAGDAAAPAAPEPAS
jgi:hypothetical protein